MIHLYYLRTFLTGLLFMLPMAAGTITLSFDSYTDNDMLTNQVPGLTFSNAVVLSAGITLNEFEFPPRSGANVLTDFGGPIFIDFSSPVSTFSGYFTYLSKLTLTAYDGMGNIVASAASGFDKNLAISGNPPAPNEFITISNNPGFVRLRVLADANGNSFALDDMTVTTATSVPEPGLMLPTAFVGCIFLLVGAARSRKTGSGRLFAGEFE